MDVTYDTSRYANTRLLINDALDVVMDALYISSQPNISVVDGVRIVFIDAVLNKNADIILPAFCDIACHQIVDSNMSLIRQLIVDCNSTYFGDEPISIRSNTEYESFEYWSAERLILNNHTSSTVYPGGSLPISYSIVDRYGDIVDDYAANISIRLYTYNVRELLFYSYLLIDENGQCPLCEDGIYVQGISIDDVNRTYTITVDVDGDVLIANDINFTVAPCSSGYAVFGGQCSECIDGLYSIDETVDECIICDEDLLDDMIQVKSHYTLI